MDFLNGRLQHHMPLQQKVKVDSEPRISSIYDNSNATLGAQNPSIRLPAEFYDPQVRSILDKLAFDEEFGPFRENKEYRTLGIGALLGDVVERMTQSASPLPQGPPVRLAFSGGHDSTLMGILGALGVLEGKHKVWPPYSSSISLELFRKKGHLDEKMTSTRDDSTGTTSSVGRIQTAELSTAQKDSMKGYYVRVRYNDHTMLLPGCKDGAKHLEGDESFCTLVRLSLQ